MSIPQEELLNPADERCAEVRELMLAVADRDLTELEALRVERHVDGCVACLRVLEGRQGLAAEQDRLVRSTPAPQPNDAQWASLEDGLANELGLSTFGARDREPARPLTFPASAPPGSSGWGHSWLPMAAAILFTALVVHNLSKPATDDNPGSSVAVIDLPAVQIRDLPDNQSPEIFFGEEEDGGVVVFMTSDDE